VGGKQRTCPGSIDKHALFRPLFAVLLPSTNCHKITNDACCDILANDRAAANSADVAWQCIFIDPQLCGESRPRLATRVLVQ